MAIDKVTQSLNVENANVIIQNEKAHSDEAQKKYEEAAATISEAAAAQEKIISEEQARADEAKKDLKEQQKAQETINELVKKNEEARASEAQKNRAKELIQQDKIKKSTIQKLSLQEQLLSNTFNDIYDKITNLDLKDTEKLELLDNVTKAMEGGVGSDNLEDTLVAVSDAVGDIPGVLEVIQKAAKTDRAAQQKIDKLKEKEAKQDEFKKKFSFKENVEKVKAFSKSAFDKIKDLILKGALFSIIMLLPKFLNSQLFKDILAAIEGDFSGLRQQFYDNWDKITVGLLTLFTVFFPNAMFFIIKSIASVFTSFIKGGFMIIIKALGLLFKLIKFTFLKVIIAPIMALFNGLVSLLVPIFGTFLAPIIAIAALVALAFAGIYLFLKHLRDKLNVSSIGDVILIAWGHIQDAFASFVNMLVDLVNKIMETVGSVADFLGVDVDLPQFERMSTDNAEKALKAAQLKKAEEDAKKAEEERAKANQQSNIVANSGNTNINTNSSSVTNMLSQGMPEISIPNNFGFDEVMAR